MLCSCFFGCFAVQAEISIMLQLCATLLNVTWLARLKMN